MAVDPNDTARQAFGHADPPASPAPSARSAQELADWRTRAGAFLLDQILIAAVAIVAGLLAGGPEDETGRWVTYGVAGLVGALYAPVLMARTGARNGQTLGKQAVGIRVVRTSGAPLTLRDGFLRTVIGQQVPTALTFYLYALVDYLWPLRDARRQALHDKVAGTLVVQAAASSALRPAGEPPQAPPPSARRVDEAPVGGWLPPRPGG